MTTPSEIIRDTLYNTLDSRIADLLLDKDPDSAANIAIAIGHARLLAGCAPTVLSSWSWIELIKAGLADTHSFVQPVFGAAWLDGEMQRKRELAGALAEKVTAQ